MAVKALRQDKVLQTPRVGLTVGAGPPRAGHCEQAGSACHTRPDFRTAAFTTAPAYGPNGKSAISTPRLQPIGEAATCSSGSNARWPAEPTIHHLAAGLAGRGCAAGDHRMFACSSMSQTAFETPPLHRFEGVFKSCELSEQRMLVGHVLHRGRPFDP